MLEEGFRGIMWGGDTNAGRKSRGKVCSLLSAGASSLSGLRDRIASSNSHDLDSMLLAMRVTLIRTA